ncbi:DUF4235 domain-containing protein [Streptomyces sp. SBR177]|uniref:DUF4235 domain-containing protein n=1 Tax=Streptomyces sp. NPDC046275 TaxID=3157201 RepID=UPI0033FCDE6D
MKASAAAYKPASLALGVTSGLLAGAAFKKTWQLLKHEDEAPKATDEERRWGEVLLAAALQGAVFALVKAAVARGGASTMRRLTGTWPA